MICVTEPDLRDDEYGLMASYILAPTLTTQIRFLVLSLFETESYCVAVLKSDPPCLIEHKHLSHKDIFKNALSMTNCNICPNLLTSFETGSWSLSVIKLVSNSLYHQR